MSTVEVLVGQVGLALALTHGPVRALAARAGLVSADDERVRDGRTVELLAADVVKAATRLLALVYAVVGRLWDRMGRADPRVTRRRADHERSVQT